LFLRSAFFRNGAGAMRARGDVGKAFEEAAEIRRIGKAERFGNCGDL